MDLSFTEEQKLLQDSVRKYLDRDYAFEARKKLVATGGSFSRAHWNAFAENGWLMASIPEAYDGLGGGAVETALVCEEFGRSLVLEPFIPSAVFATQLVLAAGTEAQKKALLPKLGSGETIGAVAWSEPAVRGEPERVAVAAKPAGGGYVISGRKSLVLGAPVADMFLVAARIGGKAGDSAGVSLFVIPAKTPGLRLHEAGLIDDSRSADIVLENVTVGADAVLGSAGNGVAPLRAALDHALLALSAEAVGAMDKVLWMTAEYLKTRKQFGVPIGSFQALQHRMADMAIDVEMARSMLFKGFEAMATGEADERSFAVSGVRAFIAQKARWVTGQGIQLHGGIGMTVEMQVGHYFRHQVAADAFFGSADVHLQRVTEDLQAQVRAA